MKRLMAIAAVAGMMGLLLVACGDDDDEATGTATTVKAAPKVTVEVDNRSDEFNYEAIAYFPDKLTVAPGTTVDFHSNFLGEPHTVTLGSSIKTMMDKFASLSEEEQQGPPPQEIQDLKIPFIFPDDADFSDLAALKFNQSAAQPCYLAAGAFAPGLEPCPTATAPAFDGTQPFYNSGLMKDGEVFSVPLADNLAPGTYPFICLFHGPEMAGELTVAAEGAQDAAAVKAAGDAKLAESVGKIKPELDKATAEAKAGTVKSGVGVEEHFGVANVFAPEGISVPVGGTVTWDLSFHTVSFNAPEDARPDVIQDADGTWHFNAKGLVPEGYTPPSPPEGGDEESDTPPPPLNVNGGKWDGAGFFSSGSIDYPGDVLFKLTFTKAGTYEYLCLIHTDMEGTVTVG